MVATVGSISIDLAVKSAAFEAGFKRAGTTVERESSRMSKATAAASKSIDSLSSVAARFGGALGGAFAGREIIRYADAWTEAGNKIRAAGEVAGRQGRSLRELNDIATQTRSGLTETVDLYAKLLRATGDVAKSETEVARATEIVNKAFKAGGAAAQEQAAGILQLGQALGSGILQGDELRSLRENAPLLAQAIAKEFNTTVAGLKELGAAGELTSERVFKAILAGGKQIEDAFAQTEATIGDGLTRVKNAGTELIGTLSEITGGAGSLSGELQQFGAEIERTSDAIARFANDPSVRSFFEDLMGASIRPGSIADRIAEEFNDASVSIRRNIQDIQAEIAKLEAEKDEGGILAGIIGRNNDAEILKLKARLSELTDELRRVEVQSHGSFAALKRSAEDASMAALAALKNVAEGINSIPSKKTVTIDVRGGQIGVTSFNGIDAATAALTNPVGSTKKKTIDPLGNHQTFAEGGFTGNVPADRVAGLVHGGEFVFDAAATRKIGVENLEAIRRGVQGYEAGGAVGTVAALTGGRDKLSAIDDNTFQTAENTVRSIGYLETLVKDGQTMLAELRRIEAAIGDIEINVPAPSGGGGSFDDGMSVSSGGGFSSGTGGSGTVYSINDPNSPYFYNANFARPGGATYDPLADAFFNGNIGALRNLSADQIGNIYTAQSTNIAGNTQNTQAMLDALIQGAMSSGGGTYGGGLTFSAGGSSEFLGGGGFFGSGSRLAAIGTNINPDGATARTEDMLSRARVYGFDTGGMIHPGDTQPVQFFKRPDEAVGVFRPEQMAAIGDAMSSPGNVNVHYHAAPGNPDPSPRAMMELRDMIRQTVLSVNAGL